MVPGQVITQETIDFMRKLDVKEIPRLQRDAGPQAGASGGLGEVWRPPSAGVVSARRGVSRA